jgi:hypothetical protein
MIDTLERSSSASSSERDEELEGSRTRRNKGTTSKRDHHHHRHRSLEYHQQQLQGRLPLRGSVSTLFRTAEPRLEGEIEDEDGTIAHTRRNLNVNEPAGGTSKHHYAHIVSQVNTIFFFFLYHHLNHV